MQNQLTIVRKSRYLSLYPIQHIDSQTKLLLEKHISLISIPSYITKTYIKLLDCYLGLVGKKLFYKLLGCSESCLTTFEGFVASIKSGQLIQLSRQSKESYQRATNRLIDSLRDDFPNIRDLNNKSNSAFEQIFDINMIEYYQGWFVSGKSKAKQSFLNLVWFSKQFSLGKSRILHQSAKGYFVRLVSTRNALPTLNEFFIFLEINYSSISESDLQNSNFTSSIVSEFCHSYFHSKKDEGRCFETSIKRWNDSIEVMNKVIFDSGVFKGEGRGFPYVPPKRKTGEDSQVITTEIGSEVKVKLLTDIPIYVTDDQAIELLFVKIHADVGHVVNWAESCVSEQFKNFKNNGHKFNYQDLGTGYKNIRKKYNVKVNKGETQYELAKSFGLPTSYTLEPYMFLLINEHQEITEAFLLGLVLYDKFDHLVGIEKNDSGTWLVGYKGRKGAGSSQQKILLNQKSEQIVEKILEVTSPLRKFLKEKEDINYRYMFLSSGTAMQYPKKVPGTLEGARQEKQGGRERVEEIMSYSQLNIEDAKLFVKNLTLAKFRSSRALEVYLETGSAQSMADALGHAKYKPELLSHYLPEPILQFFQSRWISIFQKAIVCKAMEGSSNILKATKFQSMEELDEFLKNHALQNIPDNEKVDSELVSNNTNDNADSVFISVDEDILTALLSLEKAVNESNIKVSPKAMYWANFSSTLSKEIESQDYDINLNKILASAKENIDVCSMRQVIHENV